MQQKKLPFTITAVLRGIHKLHTLTNKGGRVTLHPNVNKLVNNGEGGSKSCQISLLKPFAP